MEKYLIYAHPSIPPVGIKNGQWYSLGELKEKFDIEYITQFFMPSNFGWEECEEIYPKKKKESDKVTNRNKK